MTFEEKIAALTEDIVTLKKVQEEIEIVNHRDNENGEGSCMLSAICVLLREAVMHYEEEIAILKGPEAA